MKRFNNIDPAKLVLQAHHNDLHHLRRPKLQRENSIQGKRAAALPDQTALLSVVSALILFLQGGTGK